MRVWTLLLCLSGTVYAGVDVYPPPLAATPLPTSTPANTPVPTATARPTDTPAPTATPVVDSGGSYHLPNYTVATLPTCDAAKKYAVAAVSDAVACTFGATLTGSGALACPVMCDGSQWVGG